MLPPVVVDIGALAGVGVAILTFTGLVLTAVTRAVRHVVRDENVDLKEDLKTMRSDLATVKDEVTYNSGTSLKDAAKRIEDKADEAKTEAAAARAEVRDLRNLITQAVEQPPKQQ